MPKLKNSELFSSAEYNIIEKTMLLTTPNNIRYKYSNITQDIYKDILELEDPDNYIHYELDAPERFEQGRSF